MHHLVFAANPPKRKAKRRTGKMPPALAKYWAKKNKSSMSSRKRRKRTRKVSRRKARRTIRRSHRKRHVRRHRRARRVHRIRRRAKYRTVTKHVVRHVTRRVRVNPSGVVGQIGGIVAGQLGLSLLSGLIAAKLLASSTSTASASTKAVYSAGITGGLGVAGYMLLRRKYPYLALGLATGAATSVVMELMAAAGLSLLGASSAALATSNTPAAGTTAAGTTNTGAGTTSQATGAYLGAMRKRRRMGAYLGASNKQVFNRLKSNVGMGAYLSPGQPIQSLVGPVSPARKTFGNRAGNLSGMYTSGPAFRRDAWNRR